MGALKWYKRDPRAALIGMMELSLAERGAYTTVLDLIYVYDGALPDSPEMITGYLRVSPVAWGRIRTRLISAASCTFTAAVCAMSGPTSRSRRPSNASHPQQKRGWPPLTSERNPLILQDAGPTVVQRPFNDRWSVTLTHLHLHPQRIFFLTAPVGNFEGTTDDADHATSSSSSSSSNRKRN
jgi:hypothetical protein